MIKKIKKNRGQKNECTFISRGPVQITQSVQRKYYRIVFEDSGFPGVR